MKTTRLCFIPALLASALLCAPSALDAQQAPAEQPADPSGDFGFGGGRGNRGNRRRGNAEGGGGAEFGAYRRGDREGRGEFGGGFGFGGGRPGGRAGRRGSVERASYAPLELRGIMGRGENALISITNPITGESQWVRLRDNRAKWYVESINPKTRSVVVLLNNMSVKLEMITTAGDGTPETVRPQPKQITDPASVAENSPGAGEQSSAASSAFDPKAIASQMMSQMASFRAGGQAPTSEQAQAFGAKMSALSTEQRQQVFAQLRALRTGENAAPAASTTSGKPVTTELRK